MDQRQAIPLLAAIHAAQGGGAGMTAAPPGVAPASAAMPPIAQGMAGMPAPAPPPPLTAPPAPATDPITGNPYFPAAFDIHFGLTISDTLESQYDLKGAPPDLKNDVERLKWAVGKRALELIKSAAEERAPRDGMVRESMEAIYMIPPDRASPLGEDGANLRTPLTYQAYATLHAFFMEVTTGVRPYAKTEPTRIADKDAANKIEDLLDAALTEQIEYEAVQDEAIAVSLIEGTAFLKPCWQRVIGTQRDYVRLSPGNAADYGFDLPRNKKLHIDGTVVKHRRTGAQARFGQTIDASREIMLKNQPAISVVSYFDYVQWPARCPDPDQAALVGHRFYKTISDLRADAKSGLYDPEAVARLEASSYKKIDPQNRTNLLFDSYATEDAFEEEEFDMPQGGQGTFDKGKHIKPGSGDVDKRTYANTLDTVEIVEFIMRFDNDGDNLEEDWLFAVETSGHGTLLKGQHYYGAVGARPLIPMVVFRRPGKLYGMPLGQVLEGLQEESDLTTNMSLDAGAMNLTAIVEEVKNSATNLVPQEISVGINHRLVDDENQIKVHTFPMPTQDSFRQTELVDQMAEKVTAASEIFSGATSRGDKTATETNQSMTSGARRLKVQAKRIQRANGKALNIVLGFMKRLSILPGDEGQVSLPLNYALTRAGERVYGEITLEELQTPVKLFPHGDTINTNEALQMQGAEKVFMMSERSKLINASTVREYEATADVLRSFGRRNVQALIGTLQEAKAQDDQAKANPPPNMPALPPNVTVEWLAAYLAANPQNPTVAAITQALAQLSQAENAGKGGSAQTDAAGNVLDPQGAITQAKAEIAQHSSAAMQRIAADHQLKSQQLDHERQLAERDLQHQSEIERLKTTQSAQSAVQSVHAAHTDAAHGLEMQSTQVSHTLDAKAQETAHKGQMQEQKIVAAKKATPPKPSNRPRR